MLSVISLSKKGIIEFSLVEECCNKKDEEVLKDINDSFCKENIVIPWCDKIVKITLA